MEGKVIMMLVVMLVSVAQGENITDLAPTEFPSLPISPSVTKTSQLTEKSSHFIATSKVDFRFGKKLASECPDLCEMFCITESDSGDQVEFEVCYDDCVDECFSINNGIMTPPWKNMLSHCSLKCVKHKGAVFGFEANKVEGYMENCYDYCKKY